MRAFIVFLFLLPVALSASRNDRNQMIEGDMRKRYDLSAVTSFLKEVIRQHPRIEAVSLTSTKVGTEWRLEKVDPPRRMRNGDWVIWDQKDEDEAFDLYYGFDATHVVTIHARRHSRDKFEFQVIDIDEWVTLL